MRIVLGIHDFVSFAGTQTYTLTIAEELASLGHDVVIAADVEGPIAELARERGVAVVSSPARLPDACDATIAQDAATAYALAGRYPDSRRLMVAHSDYFAVQSPPQLDGVCHGVVVLNDRVRRRIEGLALPPSVVRLRQPVDLKRFGSRATAPAPAPRRALLLGNYLRGATSDAVVAACRQAGFEPIAHGHQATPTGAPERAIADVDVVIGLGRCVVEAMASRRAAYVYGIAGGDGWVTPDRYAALEADGFGGIAEDRVVDTATLARELAEWDPEMGARNRQLAEAHHGAGPHAAELVAALRAVRPDAGPIPGHADELARLVRSEWQTWARFAGALDENRELRQAFAEERTRGEALLAQERTSGEDLDRLLAEERAYGEELRRRLAAAEAEIDEHKRLFDALRATRRVRLGAFLAAPVDALRRGKS